MFNDVLGPVEAGSVRVSAEKLDALLARIGELLVARRRVQSRVAELALLEEFIEHWENDWRGVERLIEGICGDKRPAFQPGNGKVEMTRRVSLILRQNGTRLRRLKKDVERLAATMKSDSRLLEQVVVPLDDEVHAVRMLPFAEVCAGLDRAVRDLAQAGGKEVELVVQGGTVELDRSILEGLKDPLRHLVRNAIDHGIEAPARRQQTGKSRCGRIVVAAALRGSQVEVTVEDDGRGLDLEALREQARRRRPNAAGSSEIPVPADQELVDLIFVPGVSTASIITDVSGRGVGLDVVKSRVESLHGTVAVSFVAGQQTCFTLTVPLTLTTLRAALVSAGGQTFAIAGTSVHKFVRAGTDDLRTVAGRDMLVLGGQPVPFASLCDVLRGSRGRQGDMERERVGDRETKSLHVSPRFPVLIVAAGDKPHGVRGG